MTGLIGTLCALALLILFAWRGVNLILLSAVCAGVAALAAGAPAAASYTQIYMPAAAAFIADYFPLFLLGAVFGRLMDETGAAEALAAAVVRVVGESRAVAAVAAACAALTYGGVSLFVVAFAMFPVATALFRAAGAPRRLIPAAIALGAFTFTMTALPGAPAIQNAIPMPYFGTTLFAAPGLGLIASAVMAGFGLAWLGWRVRRLAAAGETWDGAPASGTTLRPADRERAQDRGYDLAEAARPAAASAPTRPPAAIALSAVLIVLVGNLVLSTLVFTRLDSAYLAEPEWGATRLDAVAGLWSILASLCLAILFLLATLGRRLEAPLASLGAGANASALPIFNTACLVGFGAVVASLPTFALVREAIEGIGGGPLISLAASTSVLAGLTGSASGGMRIALDALGADYAAMAAAGQVSAEALHRVTAIATGGLDALPHNGAVVTLLSLCGLSHRQSYPDLFMVAVAGPLLALGAVLAVAMSVGSF